MTPERITFVSQPRGSNLCGQCCVAMLLNTTLETAKKLVGKGGRTSTRHIRVALEQRGLTLGPRLDAKKVPAELGTVYMARVHWRKGGKVTHWVVVNGFGKVVDPYYGFDPPWTRDGVAYISSLYAVGSNPAADA